jgi:hypothetical protein
MSTDVAIIGTGNVGAALARSFARHGRPAFIANTRGPDSFRDLAREVEPWVRAVALDDALDADVLVLAIPFLATETLGARKPSWRGHIVVDATNAFLVPNSEASRRTFVDRGRGRLFPRCVGGQGFQPVAGERPGAADSCGTREEGRLRCVERRVRERCRRTPRRRHRVRTGRARARRRGRAVDPGEERAGLTTFRRTAHVLNRTGERSLQRRTRRWCRQVDSCRNLRRGQCIRTPASKCAAAVLRAPVTGPA